MRPRSDSFLRDEGMTAEDAALYLAMLNDGIIAYKPLFSDEQSEEPTPIPLLKLGAVIAFVFLTVLLMGVSIGKFVL